MLGGLLQWYFVATELQNASLQNAECQFSECAGSRRNKMTQRNGWHKLLYLSFHHFLSFPQQDIDLKLEYVISLRTISLCQPLQY